MSARAGDLFRCVCCSEAHPSDTGVLDAQLAGPVCPDCRRLTLWATAALKKAGIVRPMGRDDVNESNYSRFNNY